MSQIYSCPCPMCGTPVPRERILIAGREYFQNWKIVCSDCDEKRAICAPDDAFLGLFKRQCGEYALALPGRLKTGLRPVLEFHRSSLQNLVIFGPPGDGKSCAAALAVRELRQPFRWHSSPALRQVALDASLEEGEARAAARRKWDTARTIGILVIDDAGKERATTAWTDKLFSLLESRGNAGLKTIVTTNFGPGDFAEKLAADCHDFQAALAIERRIFQKAMILTAGQQATNRAAA